MSAERIFSNNWPRATDALVREWSRRRFLGDLTSGLGAVALTSLLERRAAAEQGGQERAPRSPYAARPPHFAPRAKRVIQIFCLGGVSHLDTFDHKPELERRHGQTLTGKGKIDNFFGQPGNLMKSPYRFARYGESGQWVSELFPELATCVDDMAFIHSMVARSNNHTPATFQMNSGFTLSGFPSMGAWVSYGLGSENEDLPAYVVLPDRRGLPPSGAKNWTSGFLPATHQGTAFRTGAGEPVFDLATPSDVAPAARRAGLEFVEKLNRRFAASDPAHSGFAAQLGAYELAAKMQLSVPEVADISTESAETAALYGLDRKESRDIGQNCLLARRLVERGVRFVQLFHGGPFGGNPRINWDAHENIVRNHGNQAATIDRPVAGLLKDLKRRGLLEDTLVIGSTEFGRSPITQGLKGKGRDHHQHAFTCWLAGAGVKEGYRHGASDEVGYFAAEKPTSTYDLHATILHLLGLDHERLAFYHNGIERRLTDVHGHVVDDLLA